MENPVVSNNIVTMVDILYIGGSDLYLRNSFFEKIKQLGYALYTICPRDVHYNYDSQKNWSEINLSSRFSAIKDLSTLYQIYKMLLALRPTLLHAYDTRTGIVSVIAGKIAGVPTLVRTVNGRGRVFSSSNFLSNFMRLFYAIVQIVICRMSTVTILQNQDDYNYFTKLPFVEIEKLRIIKGSGVDVALLEQKLQIASVNYVEQKRTFNILCISRLLRSKGIIDFCEVAKHIKTKHQNICFILAGPIDESDNDRITLDDLKPYSEVVNYIGYENNVANLLAQADLFILPSYYGEGIPRVLLEAAVCKVALLVSNVVGCRDLVVDGDTGRLFTPGDIGKIVEIIELLYVNKDLRCSLADNVCYNVKQYYSIDKIVEEHYNLYSELL